MGQSAHLGVEQENLVLNFDELEISLFNPSVVPALVNPDFLRHNAIVSPDWAVEAPVMIDSQISVVKYVNGISFRATRDYLAVSQEPAEESFTLDEVVCPEIAEKCLDRIPMERPYETIGFDFTGTIIIEEKNSQHITSPLRELGNRLSHNSVTPDVQTRMRYHFPDKEMTLYVFEMRPEDANELIGLFFNGEIRVPVVGDNEQDREIFMRDALKKWEEDAYQFRLIASEFYSMYFAAE